MKLADYLFTILKWESFTFIVSILTIIFYDQHYDGRVRVESMRHGDSDDSIIARFKRLDSEKNKATYKSIIRVMLFVFVVASVLYISIHTPPDPQ